MKRLPKISYITRKALREGLAWASSSPVGWQRRAAQPVISEMYRRYHRLFPRTSHCYITKGISAANGQTLRVKFVGFWQTEQEPALDRYENLLFQPGTADREDLGPFQGLLRGQAETRADEVDLVAALGDRSQVWVPSAGKWVLGSATIRKVFNFNPGETWKNFLSSFPSSSPFLGIQELGLLASISHRKADFSRFYQEMYRPTVQNDPINCGEYLSQAAARSLFEEHPSILMIENRDGQVIAGALCFLWGRAIYKGLAGVWQGDQELIQQGMLAACDFFGMRWALEKGCGQYDTGLCLPFLTDHDYAQWQAWGGSLIRDVWHPDSVLIWAPAGSEAGAAWLKANPVDPTYSKSGGAYLAGGAQYVPVMSPKSAQENFPVPVTAQSQTLETDHYQVESFGSIQPEARRVIEKGLYHHSLEALGPEIGTRYKPLDIIIRDTAQEVVGGLIGRFTWNYLHVDSLWVSSDHRGHELGTRIMMIAENAARAEEAQFITLETTSFEAIGFYLKLGYEIVGQIEDMPPGHTFYYLKKVL